VFEYLQLILCCYVRSCFYGIVFNCAVSTTVVGSCVSKFLLNCFMIGGGGGARRGRRGFGYHVLGIVRYLNWPLLKCQMCGYKCQLMCHSSVIFTFFLRLGAAAQDELWPPE
jgi:hypothetical protein